MSKENIRRLARLFEDMKVLPPERNGRLWPCVEEVHWTIDRKHHDIHVEFDLDGRRPTREMLEDLVNFRFRKEAKFLKFRFGEFDWDDVEQVRDVVSVCIDIRPSALTLEEDLMVIHTKENDAVNRHVSLLRGAMKLIYGKGPELNIVTDSGYRPPEEPSPAPVSDAETPAKKGVQTRRIEGDFCCFKLEAREDHGGKKKYKVGFTNQTDFYWLSIADRKSGPEGRAEKLYKSLKINHWYRIVAACNVDRRFADCLDGFLQEAAEVHDYGEGLGRMGEYDQSSHPEVACALCIHTKNSAFDGLYTAQEMVEEAALRGHEVIGIADAGSVQSFAEFERAVTRVGMKGLYGVELEVVPRWMPVLMGGWTSKWQLGGVRDESRIAEKWDKKSYCILDIETTGLYSIKDEIIQIAARKYTLPEKDFGQLLESLERLKRTGTKDARFADLDGITCVGTFEEFLRIERRMSDRIVQMTGITREKIRMEGKPLKDTFRALRKFLGGSIVVAHNGIDFDIPFLNAHMRRCGAEEIRETVLDTLNLSRYLFAGKCKSFSLAALAKKHGINYNEEEAHNALYDVDVLSVLFFAFILPELHSRENIKPKQLPTLNNLYRERGLRQVWGENVLIYIKTQAGVRELYELVSLAHTRDYCDGVKLWKGELTEERRKNLLVVSNPMASDRGLLGAVLKGDKKMFQSMVKWFDYVIIPSPIQMRNLQIRDELSDQDMRDIVKTFVEWCEDERIKYMFTGAIRYVDKEMDAERYAVLVNTKGIAGRRHYLANEPTIPDLHFKYTDEIMEEYRGVWSDYEWRRKVARALRAQGEFIDATEPGIVVVKKSLHPPKIVDCEEMLRKECERRLKAKYGKKCKDEFLWRRYEQELDRIVQNRFSVIYWFSHLLVKESVSDGYLVGSRGSVGSSFVAYLAGISEVNPLPPHHYCGDCGVFELAEDFKESGFDLPEKRCGKCGKIMGSDGHDIPFETFLGFDGNKVPDIDLNFSGEYQLRAHNFLLKYFGEGRVFRAGTIGTMAEKTAVAVVEKYRESREFDDCHWTKGRKVWLADKLVDVKRTTGQHPGGILVVPEDMSIFDFSPVNFPANDTSSTWLTTHFAFEDLHDALLKFDILGHDDPTTLKLLRELTGFDPLNVPCRDPNLIKLYSSCGAMNIGEGELMNGETTGALGLPEFGTGLTRKIIQACRPQTFADLIRISGFSHGTGVWKRNIDELIKGGKSLNSVITCRDDIMLYLMREGLSRQDAFEITESIRKGKGLSQRQEDVMRENGVPDWYIESAKKISYIFPKAHATAYVLMSWRIAYYKLYHPLAFYAAYFTIALHSFDMEVLMQNDREHIKSQHVRLGREIKAPGAKGTAMDKAKMVIYEVAYEFLARGFRFENVCVNKSEVSLFVPDNETKSLRIPLMAVSGCGEQMAKNILEGRKQRFYRTMQELKEKGGVNNKIIEKMKAVGILPDGLPMTETIFDETGTLIKSIS